LLLLLPTTAIALLVSQYHLIRTSEGMMVVRKWTGTFVDTYVDARTPPFADPTNDPSLADTLIFAGRTGLLEHPRAVVEPPATPTEALARGIRYLEVQQQSDGAWRSFMSTSRDFTKAVEQPRVFPTIMVLLATRDVPGVQPVTALKGLVYLRTQMRDDMLLAVDGRNHELSHRWDHLPCVMPPDADDTALAWVLLGRGAMPADSVHYVYSVFQKHVAVDGLYPTYFTSLGEWTCPADFGNHPSLGVNVDVLSFMQHFGYDVTRLLRGIDDALAVYRYWEQAVYYRSVDVLAFLAAMAVVNGASAAEPLLDRFLADHALAMEDGPPSALERAAYVAAASERCLRRGTTCDELRGDVDELRRQQREDGSWPAAPLYHASLGFYGSPAESTAIAVRALSSWTRTPAGAAAP
jgi:hypothetical protein